MHSELEGMIRERRPELLDSPLNLDLPADDDGPPSARGEGRCSREGFGEGGAQEGTEAEQEGPAVPVVSSGLDAAEGGAAVAAMLAGRGGCCGAGGSGSGLTSSERQKVALAACDAANAPVSAEELSAFEKEWGIAPGGTVAMTPKALSRLTQPGSDAAEEAKARQVLAKTTALAGHAAAGMEKDQVPREKAAAAAVGNPTVEERAGECAKEDGADASSPAVLPGPGNSAGDAAEGPAHEAGRRVRPVEEVQADIDASWAELDALLAQA